MLRVLLVLDDYGELMFLQTVLKKIGFDVDSTQNPRKFSDSLLAMNPDVLVLTATGKRVKGVELVEQVKKNRGLPKVIMIRNGSLSADAFKELRVDAWLESPVGAPDLLDKIAELHNLNKQILQEKLLKLRMQETSGEDPSRVLKMNPNEAHRSLDKSAQPHNTTSFLQPSKISSDERQSRYKKFIDEIPSSEKGFVLKEVQAQVKSLREGENQKDLEDLERERRAFVELLFKKKSA